MNKLSKEKRSKLLLVAIGTGGILAALYLLVISAQQTALAEYADKTGAAKDKVAKAESWLRMEPGIQARLTACRKELETKQENMAPVDKFKWFYNTLEKFLAGHHANLIDITREPELGDVGVLPKFPYQAASFGVKLTARYHDLGIFLAELENHFPYMRVQNVQLEPEGFKGVVKDEGLAPQGAPTSERLAITMRVVTLVKPIETP